MRAERDVPEIEQLTIEWATLHDEWASVREELKKANGSCEGVQTVQSAGAMETHGARRGGGRARTGAGRQR
jgi:hypothetical protein